MSWIKRNLYFVIGTLVAVVLTGLAVFYLFQNLAANTKGFQDWNQAYSDLKQLQDKTPHPGDKTVNNIQNGQNQQAQLRWELAQARTHFARIPAIPDTPTVGGEDFTSELRTTLSEMRRRAVEESVTLPSTNYNFTFESILPQITFSQRSLQALAVQLGEVKALCNVLFDAKVNSLENLRREQVCREDQPDKAATDYLDAHSVTNDLAVMSPYEITFRCFSPELAAVVAGFANSTNGFIIKTINIEPAPPVATEETPTLQPTYAAPAAGPATPSASSVADMYRRRYGIAPGGGRSADRYSTAPRPPPPPPPVYAPPAVTPGAAPAAPKGPQTILDEKPVKVTLLVEVVKLTGLPGAGAPAGPARSKPSRRP